MNEHTRRQRLVPEIGDEGQARIARSVATVSAGGLHGEIARRYLKYAGFAEVRGSNEREPEDDLGRGPVEQVLAGADPAVRAIALGANDALREIRRAVKGDS